MTPTRREVLVSGGAIAAGSTFTSIAETRAGSAVDASKADSNSEPLCLSDFEPLAKAKIPPMGWEYMTAGAADELTLKWNSEAYQRLRLKPRILVDVSRLDTSIVLLGRQHSVPILLAPVASHKLYHPEGEIATVRGASSADVTLVVTTPASTSLEDVAAAAKTPLWFQVYVQRDRDFTRALIQRAEKAGYQALCLTVDSPVFGARNREERAHVKYPGLPNLQGLKDSQAGVYLAKGQDIYSPISDPTVTWKTIEWMRSVTKLPIVAKGVLNPDDAELAIKSGVSAIIISNHGGRNLDPLPPTIDVLRQSQTKWPSVFLSWWTAASAGGPTCSRPRARRQCSTDRAALYMGVGRGRRSWSHEGCEHPAARVRNGDGTHRTHQHREH